MGTAYSVFCTVQESPCPEGSRWAAGTELDFSLTSGTSALLKETVADGGGTLDTCKGSTAKGKLTNAGSPTENATGEITALTWSTCTFPTTTTLKRGLEVKTIAGTHNGTVIADEETTVTINTILFGSCVYTVPSGQSAGDLTEGKPAVFHANAIAHKATGSEAVCPTTAVWTATYTLTEPNEKALSVETN